MPRMKITPRQRRYAYNIMNTDTTKGQAMQDAGYSSSASRVPARLENSTGFKLAMASIFAQSGNVSMAILNELDAKIQNGDLQQQDTKTLIAFFDTMTRAMERIAPKSNNSDDEIANIFGGVFGDIVDNEKIEQSSDTTQDLTDIVSDVVMSDDNQATA